jgi:hypothetical protein
VIMFWNCWNVVGCFCGSGCRCVHEKAEWLMASD